MNRTIAVFFVVATFAALAAAYDFNDPIYNQIIKQNIDELEANYFNDDSFAFANVRHRRDEDAAKAETGDKCRRRRWKTCCGDEIVDEIIEKDKDLKKECFKEVMALSKDDKGSDPFSCEKITKTKKEWAVGRDNMKSADISMCVIQCTGQKKGILDEDGNVKQTEMVEHLKSSVGKEEWLYKIMEQVLPKCLEQAKNGTEFVKDKEDPLSCNPVSIKMHHCMWREMQLACPDDKITDMKTCSKIREKIEKKADFASFKHHQAFHDDDK